jgi:hypothetical protein
LSEWNYNSRYVELGENGAQFRTTWEYESEEQTIDAGRMTVVQAVTNDLVSVESVVIK